MWGARDAAGTNVKGSGSTPVCVGISKSNLRETLLGILENKDVRFRLEISGSNMIAACHRQWPNVGRTWVQQGL